jgi:hypothetical protein
MLSSGGRGFLLAIDLLTRYVLNEAQFNSGFFFLNIINIEINKVH